MAANFSAPGRLLMFVSFAAQHNMVWSITVKYILRFSKGDFAMLQNFREGGQDFAANVNISSSFKLLSGLKN